MYVLYRKQNLATYVHNYTLPPSLHHSLTPSLHHFLECSRLHYASGHQSPPFVQNITSFRLIIRNRTVLTCR